MDSELSQTGLSGGRSTPDHNRAPNQEVLR